jgi:hypothetical protein
MTTRTARCGCGRVEVTVDGDPSDVLVCHCDFCQKRSGSVFIASALFADDQVVSIAGETKSYNGLEIDGVGAVGLPEGITYHFCTTCGSTVFGTFINPMSGQGTTSIAVGNFVDPSFPRPTAEVFTDLRHHWVLPIPGAAQIAGLEG